MTPPLRLGGTLALAAGGALTGVATLAVHGRGWGLPLVAAATLLTSYALGPGWPRVAFALGWAAPVAAILQPRPEGDFVLAADLAGYAVVVGGLLLLGHALVTLALAARPGSRTPGAEPVQH